MKGLQGPKSLSFLFWKQLCKPCRVPSPGRTTHPPSRSQAVPMGSPTPRGSAAPSRANKSRAFPLPPSKKSLPTAAGICCGSSEG